MVAFSIVVAATNKDRGIGCEGCRLPWPMLFGDMVRFREITSRLSPGAAAAGRRNAVVMGRITWESIPRERRPLSGRLNVVLSEKKGNPLASLALSPSTLTLFVKSEKKDGADERGSFDAALEDLWRARDALSIEHVFVIGGAQIFAAAVAHPGCRAIYYTEVFVPVLPEPHRRYDATFPPIPADEYEEEERGPVHIERGTGYVFLTYRRSPRPVPPVFDEQQYLDLVTSLLEQNSPRPDRTDAREVLSGFGAQMRFSLKNNTLPLLTTKRVFWKGVAEELLWMIAGKTSAKDLSTRGVRIWEKNGSRAFLDSRGLFERTEGDLGPVYGFQWRHFGAKYTSSSRDGAVYAGKGVDQLADCIYKIRNDPYSRRIVMTAWNPVDIDQMALPPCHVLCQFYVSSPQQQAPTEWCRPLLSCAVYQRSCDLGLGVPFNIASYGLLTHMVAHVCNMDASELVYVLGDYHIYSNHTEQLLGQVKRAPRNPPRVFIMTEEGGDIGSIAFEHLRLEGYDPHPSIPMPMAV